MPSGMWKTHATRTSPLHYTDVCPGCDQDRQQASSVLEHMFISSISAALFMRAFRWGIRLVTGLIDIQLSCNSYIEGISDIDRISLHWIRGYLFAALMDRADTYVEIGTTYAKIASSWHPRHYFQFLTCYHYTTRRKSQHNTVPDLSQLPRNRCIFIYHSVYWCRDFWRNSRVAPTRQPIGAHICLHSYSHYCPSDDVPGQIYAFPCVGLASIVQTSETTQKTIEPSMKMNCTGPGTISRAFSWNGGGYPIAQHSRFFPHGSHLDGMSPALDLGLSNHLHPMSDLYGELQFWRFAVHLCC